MKSEGSVKYLLLLWMPQFIDGELISAATIIEYNIRQMELISGSLPKTLN